MVCLLYFANGCEFCGDHAKSDTCPSPSPRAGVGKQMLTQRACPETRGL